MSASVFLSMEKGASILRGAEICVRINSKREMISLTLCSKLSMQNLHDLKHK